jgi:hypothetical protein
VRLEGLGQLKYAMIAIETVTPYLEYVGVEGNRSSCLCINGSFICPTVLQSHNSVL